MNLIVDLSLDKTKINKVIVYSRFSTNKVMIKLMFRISLRSQLLVNCLVVRAGVVEWTQTWGPVLSFHLQYSLGSALR